MKIKNIGGQAGILQYESNVHMHAVIYGYRFNLFGISTKQRYFKRFTLNMKVKVIDDLAILRLPFATCAHANVCQNTSMYNRYGAIAQNRHF